MLPNEIKYIKLKMINFSHFLEENNFGSLTVKYQNVLSLLNVIFKIFLFLRSTKKITI